MVFLFDGANYGVVGFVVGDVESNSHCPSRLSLTKVWDEREYLERHPTFLSFIHQPIIIAYYIVQVFFFRHVVVKRKDIRKHFVVEDFQIVRVPMT